MPKMDYGYPNTMNVEDGAYKPGIMTVEGLGRVNAAPDIVYVTLGVTTEGRELPAVQQENARRAAAVLSFLRSRGIQEKDVQTIGYSIDPLYDYTDGKQEFKGYRVSSLFRVTIRDLKEAGEIISGAVAAGANTVNRIEYALSEPDEYYRRALELAVDDAESKAHTIGKSLHTRVRKLPIEVTEINSDINTVAPKLMLEAASPVPIAPGTLELQARIRAKYEYLI